MLRSVLTGRLVSVVLLLVAGFLLAGCDEYSGPKELKPVPQKLVDKMQSLDMAIDAPVYIRAYKETSELEVWKKTRSGTYSLLNTYSICRWSGVLGPKVKEGDRQAPEGFYTITPGQMNPKSRYYLSFNIGFPNAYDRALGRTGNNIMVHGACSSAGCYSMTDESAGEIYALARDAFRGGQRSFEVHLFPFRMTAENMARHRDDPNYGFWTMLKQGSDTFAVTGQVPKVSVCGKRYVFDIDAHGAVLDASEPCPPFSVAPGIATALKAKTDQDNIIIADLAPKFAEERRIAALKAADDAARVAALPSGGTTKLVAAASAPAAAPAAAAAPALASPLAAPVAVVAAEPGVPIPVEKPVATAEVVTTGTAVPPPAAAVTPVLAGAADPAAVNAAALDPLALATVGGTPAPGMPLPLRSPMRPEPVVVSMPEPPKPTFLQRLQARLPWSRTAGNDTPN